MPCCRFQPSLTSGRFVVPSVIAPRPHTLSAASATPSKVTIKIHISPLKPFSTPALQYSSKTPTMAPPGMPST
ncbi:hypothetical protein CLOM_g16504 [Closterium sp. NIES-68]|nr:hypothetical protein CLOM_g16504 [Closterium sp. NIES-68]GJP66151.1 hypothetical protein CLOP_g23058 [Closterium sp. NIES-67]